MLMKNYNLYSKIFKDYNPLLKEDSFEAIVVLKQHDPTGIIKNMYNKPISTKVVAIIIFNKDGNPSKSL